MTVGNSNLRYTFPIHFMFKPATKDIQELSKNADSLKVQIFLPNTFHAHDLQRTTFMDSQNADYADVHILLVWSVCLHIKKMAQKRKRQEGNNLSSATMEDDSDHASLEQAATTAALECLDEETSYEYATTASANALELLQDNSSAPPRKRQKKFRLQCSKLHDG